ncbi:glycosyltransferase family 2 protein [Subsaxibacter sp. CAU 1640]|uniref:glycosyltransferase family 2 protein n=1 Tax=Subsaxibacter sp. CAU 1640 TaxID=2933271 RepID=UPI00200359C1|nr:glycosyltransferase family 2 protein [Subsaxibacter sp. CAU 1640]MCK7591720.1 glycosyltransferase family 2 protein [Subsaxibacter sp. CAU 1640]
MISALAITYNEEEHIERFIKSLSFADEIIIVDSGSTDKTVAIAKQLNATVYHRTFDNFSTQKNFTLEKATHEWIVFFDLDEMISEELASEIQSKIASNTNISAYKVKRNFHFMGKRIKYSGFQNDAVIRVFKKSEASYGENLVHEILNVKGKTATLKNTSDHYSYKSFDAYNEKLTHYAKLQAEMLYRKNKRPSLFHFFIRPLWRFKHQYVIKLGFLDGKEGFILAYLSAFAVFKRYLFLWTKYRHID